jgi:lactoylglutathione lyase
MTRVLVLSYYCAVTEILFINVASPYYFFMLEDPDGNHIEITGPWHPGRAQEAGTDPLPA